MSSSKRVFGQASRRGPTRYQRQLGSSKSANSAAQLTEEQERAERRLQMKLKRRAEDEACDERFGFCRYSHNTGDGSRSKRGWIFNLLPTVSAYIYVQCAGCNCVSDCISSSFPASRLMSHLLYSTLS
jgi:hypothetical protein